MLFDIYEIQTRIWPDTWPFASISHNGLQKSVVTENGKLLERFEPQDRLTRFEVCGEQIIDNLKFDFGMRLMLNRLRGKLINYLVIGIRS